MTSWILKMLVVISSCVFSCRQTSSFISSEHVCSTSVNGIARNVWFELLAALYQRYTCKLWGVWDTFFILSSLKSHQDPKRGESMELWISVCARVPGCFQSLGCAFRSSARGRASVFELLAAACWVCDFNFFMVMMTVGIMIFSWSRESFSVDLNA